MTDVKPIDIGTITIGGSGPLPLIAGPCVIEDFESTYAIAANLQQLCQKLQIPLIFKASFDKANRTSIESFRGPGLDQGLQILADIRRQLGLAVLSDVHRINEIEAAAEVLDVIQIPAFLCRQTDLLLAVGKTGKPVNIKKGQFLAPEDMQNVLLKVLSTGNHKVMLTERGSMFGYKNLVVDLRSIPIMQEFGHPVIFDATHSVQRPGGAGKHSGGDRQFAPVLAGAAVAAGVDAIFMEVHPDPDKALCDGANSLPLKNLEPILRRLCGLRQVCGEDASTITNDKGEKNDVNPI
jgi:2-dehydro-3-deoxyphosphooctonate aldolase (KDO 8-P synthase)